LDKSAVEVRREGSVKEKTLARCRASNQDFDQPGPEKTRESDPSDFHAVF